MPDRYYMFRSSLERLEDRTLLAVTSSLNNGLLSVALGAAGDTATLSIVGSKIDVFNGATHTQYAAAQVSALTVQGSSAASQKLFLQSPVTLTGALTASALASIEVDGQYTAKSASLSAASINLPAGSSLVATGGNVTLATADTESGVSANASAGITLTGATVTGTNVSLTANSTLTASSTGIFDGTKQANVALINVTSSANISIAGS
jgi:hypothetical protein